MKAFRVINLRSLHDTNYIDLKPITILVGQNSSGKSTLLRTFPLLRQSVEERTSGPILWNGRYVDFGSFYEAVNSDSKEEEIKFGFKLLLPIDNTSGAIYTRGGDKRRELKPLSIEMIVTIRSVKMKSERLLEEGYVCNIEIKVDNDDYYDLTINQTGEVDKLIINGEKIKNSSPIYVSQNTLIPTLIFKGEYQWRRELEKMIISQIKESQQTDANLSQTLRLLDSMRIGYHDYDFLGDAPNFESISSVLKQLKIKLSAEQESQFVTSIQIGKVSLLLRNIQNYMLLFSKSCTYIGPVRATAERYYRSQNLSVDEVDFQGKNLAVFLGSLSPEELISFNKWTEDNFNFSVKINLSSGHLSIIIKEDKAEQNLADTGFGYSQVLPVITQLWSAISSKKNKLRSFTVFAIEQPELHLHPRMQAKLAIVFSSIISQAKKSEIDIRLIIETHSEAILNTFGQLISKNKLDRDDVNVVLFEKPDANLPTSVQISTYDTDGILTNWPYGFFDPEWG